MEQRHYNKKKAKIHGPSVVGAMKRVKIDARTEIMVPVTVSDEEARERYLARVNACRDVPHGFKIGNKQAKKTQEDSDEIPQEELVGIIDDSTLPDQE